MEIIDLTKELIDQRPPMFKTDPTITAITDVHAREIERLNDAVDEVIANLIPSTAGKYLKYWEWLLQLPVEPVDELGGVLSDSARRTIVLAYLRRIKDAATGTYWQERVTDLIGTNWIYGAANPDDLRGLWWERYAILQDGIGDRWDFDSSYPYLWSELSYEADGIRLSGVPNGMVRKNERIADYEGTIKFRTREVDTSSSRNDISVIVKSDGPINAQWISRVSIVGRDELKVTTLSGNASAAITLAADTEYWLVGRIIGNVTTGEFYTTDPSKPGATPVQTVSQTLTGFNATTYGTDKPFDHGFAWHSDWLIMDVKGAEANWDVADYTVRIITPYTDGSNASALVENLLRSITPANMDIEVFNDSHFILGVSYLGYQGF